MASTLKGRSRRKKRVVNSRSSKSTGARRRQIRRSSLRSFTFTLSVFAVISTVFLFWNVELPSSEQQHFGDVEFLDHSSSPVNRRVSNFKSFPTIVVLPQRSKQKQNDQQEANKTTKTNDYSIPDYGSIQYRSLSSLSNASLARQIDLHDDLQLYENYRDSLFESMDKAEKNLAQRVYYHDDELEDDPPRGCYRPNWKSKFYPTCNNFQELAFETSVVGGGIQYRGAGHFRDAWMMIQQQQKKKKNQEYSDDNNIWILKTLRREHPISIKQHVQMSKEAIIMEQLSSCPRIVNIYGFCGVSIAVENMPYEVEDEIQTSLSRKEIHQYYENQKPNRAIHQFGMQPPLNNLTTIEKLNLAIDIAESLADIHGYQGGVIIHADTHPCQWLRNSQGQVKLNDFNNALIMDWDFQTNEFCREHHHLPGTYRAPEEHKGEWTIDDRSELFAMGGMLYTILTGVYPYWNYRLKERHSFIKTGELLPPPIEPHYTWKAKHPIEAAMVTIMNECYTYDIEQRPNIFQIVSWLRGIPKH